MTRDHFDKAAADWDKKTLRLQLAEKVIRAIGSNVPLNSTTEALEIGCGTGLVTISLCHDIKNIVATDTSTGMLDVLKEKISDMGVENIQPLLLDLNGDISSLGNSKFHLIYSSMTLHHIKDTANMLKTCSRLLHQGGSIAFADLAQEDGSFHGDMAGVEHLGFDPQELCKLAKQSGFSRTTVSEVHVINKEDAQGNLRSYPVFLLTAQKM
ncbi:MAG: class I SAM-dependent methyltransferase [Pseudomonadota bacterium]